MMLVTPCFNFRGQCREAMALYEKAFGAKTTVLLHYSDANPRDWKAPLTDAQKDYVYHAEMMIGGQRVMFSDVLAFDLAQGISLFLTVTFDTAEEVKKAYNVMKEGGTTVHPMKSTTYSSCFVNFVDRFGIRWGLMTEQTER